MTAFRPGQSPPPVRTPTRTRDRTLPSPVGRSLTLDRVPYGRSGTSPTVTDSCVIALDAGTTGVRSRAVFADGRPSSRRVPGVHAALPAAGVGRARRGRDLGGDAARRCASVVAEVGASASSTSPRSASPTSARRCSPGIARPASRTARRSSGRTAAPRARCDELAAAGHLPLVRERTGPRARPVLLGHEVRVAARANATSRSTTTSRSARSTRWLIWNLTGGAVHATDVTNASRTMLLDIRRPAVGSGAVRRCCTCRSPRCRGASVERSLRRDRRRSTGCRPASRSAASPATSRRRCSGRRASTRAWPRTPTAPGSFVLLNVGATCPPPTEGMLTTSRGRSATARRTTRSRDAIFVTGAAIQWLRDGIHIIDDAAEAGRSPRRVTDSGGVYVVPAFTGLGSPWWDPYARGTIIGITRGSTTAPHHPRGRRVDGVPDPRRGRRDGGGERHADHRSARRRRRVGRWTSLLQMQADQLGVTVQRPGDQETTALGAAFLAGLAEGVWPTSTRSAPLAARRHVPARRGPHVPRPGPRPVAARRRARPATGRRD